MAQDQSNTQRSFSSGELTPEANERNDVERYHTGLATLRNMYVGVLGGVFNRPGTQMVFELPDSNVVHKVRPFSFNSQQTYVHVYGEQKLYVIKEGGIVVLPSTPAAYNGATTYAQGDHVSDGGINYYSRKSSNTGNTPSSSPSWWYALIGSRVEIPTPYTESQLFRIDQVQSGDYVTLAHHLNAVQELVRYDHHKWILKDKSFKPDIDPPGAPTVTAYGGTTSATTPYYYKVRAVDSSGDDSNDSAIVTCNNVSSMSGDSRNYNTISWDSVAGAISYDIYILRSGTYYLQANTTSLAYTDQDGADTTFAIAAAAAVLTPPTNVNAVASTVGSKNYRYKVSAITESDSESIPSSEGAAFNRDPMQAGDRNDITWVSVSGAVEYRVYKENNGLFGYMGTTQATQFVDDNIEPDMSDTPRTDRNPFNGAGDYPAAVNYAERRMVFSNTLNEPRTVWTTMANLLGNMSTSTPAQDNDAMTFTITSDKANEIHSLVATDSMLAMTDGGVISIMGGQEGFLTPKQPPDIKNQSTSGIDTIKPLVIGRTVIALDGTKRVVRDYGYIFADNGYDSKERSVLSKHLLEDYGIIDWCYAEVPFNLIVAIREDGAFLTLTYHQEHQVFGWARHDTFGTDKFESCCSVREGSEDYVYFTTRRTINNITKRFVERLHSRNFETLDDCFFVDCGLTYDGVPTKTITGIDHLEGETVYGLADGSPISPQTVVSGQITLTNEASKVHIGRKIVSEFETLDIDPFESGLKGKLINVSDVTISLFKSKGFKIGPDSEKLTSAYVSQDDWYTGKIKTTLKPDWKSNGRIYIKHEEPLPLHILSVTPDYKYSNI